MHLTEDEYENLMCELDDLNGLVEDQKYQIETLEEDIDIKNEELNEQAAEITELEGLLSNYKEDMSDLGNERDALLDANEQLTHTINNQLRELEELREKVAYMQDEIDIYLCDINNLEVEIESMRDNSAANNNMVVNDESN